MIDKNIKEEIKKCARCALCLQKCPIYEIKKDENNTSRGLICKLNGYEKNILSEKEIKKDLKICLNCSKCKTNCPSKINTVNIFAYKNAYFSPSKISQRFFLGLKLLPLKILYFINLFKINKNKTIKNQNNTSKAFQKVYFKGCVSKAQHKTTFLDKSFPASDFLCCGLPYLTSGDLKNYNKVKEHNSKIIKNSSCVVFDCASCLSAVRDYETLSKEDKNKLVLFSDCDVDENFNFNELKLKKNSKYFNKTITFHKPCHLSESEFLKIEKILSGIKNLKYKRMENYDSCCGFGGGYFLYHPLISTKIALKKAKNIKKTNPDLILTLCPSCTLGLRFNQIVSLNFKKTLELRDFIENEIEINKPD